MAAEEEPTFPFYTSRLGFRARDVLEFYVDKIEGNEDRFQLKMLHIFLNKGIKDDIYYWSELNKVINLYCQLEEDLSRTGFHQYRWWLPHQALAGF